MYNLNTPSKKLFAFVLLGIFFVGGVSATEYDNLTIGVMNVLNALLILSMSLVVVLSVRRLYVGDLTFGELFILLVVSSLIFIIILFLAPITVNFIVDLIP